LGIPEVTERISQRQLESYSWGAATLLRGVIDAGDYKQFIFPLLFFKRLSDVYDEERDRALEKSGGDEEYADFLENHRFQIPSGAHWSDVRAVNSDVGAALQTAMRAIETANPARLFGIFGDTQWSNKERLSDRTLLDLVEHFSTLTLSLTNVPEDELGQTYEYLVKRFADDSGHTAQEFYTNRTLVHLMTQILEPQPGESIYDPTCGTGGMLLSSAVELKRQGKEYRSLKLYGQERNLMTSAIARMNLFLHGIEDFQIERGDTLTDPKFLDGDQLRQFDVVLANPPYSIKQWNRTAFSSDPYGRNGWGVPSQGRADYAFFQHIVASMKPGDGRCAILFPHGVLFRNEEREMRRNLIRSDVLEAVIGLGAGLFYNSPMEACIVVCRTAKPSSRRGRVLFINALNEVTRDKAVSFLRPEHIARIANAYREFAVVDGLAEVASLEEIQRNDWSLSIALYVRSGARAAGSRGGTDDLQTAIHAWDRSSSETPSAVRALLDRMREGVS
jgi:type I restriction enzyme M protein